MNRFGCLRHHNEGCLEFDSQSVRLDVPECGELGVLESEELLMGGPD